MSESTTFFIPIPVRRAARRGLELRLRGFRGGTMTAWARARKLSQRLYLPLRSIRVMCAWYRRHGPRARNGGTSYPGYKKWIQAGRPMRVVRKKHPRGAYRGAVSWLLWGGTPGMRWAERICAAHPRQRRRKVVQR